MRVLGISPLDKDATASFMEDGRVVFACAEERLSRRKLQDGFPGKAVRLGFERTGWDPGSLDVVAYAFYDWAEEAALIREALRHEGGINGPFATAGSLRSLAKARRSADRVDRTLRIPGFDREADEFMPPKPWVKRWIYEAVSRVAPLDWMAHRWQFRDWASRAIADHRIRAEQLAEGIRGYGLLGKLRHFHHHDTHAANAFWASGLDRALVVTFDGYGSGQCGGVYTGGPEGLQLLQRFPFPFSLGQHYENVTSGLGFKPSRHEGKIVGLAAYGDPDILRSVLRERFVVDDGNLRIRGNLNHLFTRAMAGRFSKRDVAAAYQAVLEDVTREVVGYWVARTGMDQIAVSGGVHANVKLNQRILEIPGVRGVFVYPNMGDGGCGTGAAMLACAEAGISVASFETAYLGPDYTQDEIEAALKREGLAYERREQIEEDIAQLLAEDAIVGRFVGRMEYGPRALGNRSVLYAAHDPEVNQWLNQQLGRTEFMPFAPAVLAHAAPRLFRNLAGCEKTAEYMTITFDCTEEMKRTCPAAVHVDGTARPQFVRPESNPSFYRILESYYRLTGIPALINTSFNMHEEPIVCSPSDAIGAFLLGNLDTAIPEVNPDTIAR